MDFSILHFFFPRLAESRTTIALDVCDCGMWMSTKKVYPLRRNHQYVRIVRKGKLANALFASDTVSGNRHKFNPTITVVTPNGDEISLQWACSSQKGIDFATNGSMPEVVKVKAHGLGKDKVDVFWVCSDQAK